MNRKFSWSRTIALVIVAAATLGMPSSGESCTFITLKGQDGTVVAARTMEWATFDLEPRLTLIPRGASLTAATMPDGKPGAAWKAKYGFAGIDLLGRPLFGDALNEKGLEVSLLYLPGFAEYQKYDPAKADLSLSPSDVVMWIASQFETVQQVRDAIGKVRVVPVVEPVLGFPAPAHYIVTDPGKNQIVIEYVAGLLHVYDAPLGVMTNSPAYDWHITNLRNYLNLRAVAWPDIKTANIDLKPIGVGSGMLGLPGDFTPPSRFVRAAAFSQTARKTTGGYDTVREIFRILDNFNVPIIAVEGGELPKGLKPLCCSGTQYTSAFDLKNLVIYYHTDTDRAVRKVDLKKIDFGAIGSEPIHQPLRTGEEDAIKDVTPSR